MKLHLLQFDDEQSAISDPVVGLYHYPALEGSDPSPAHWDQSVTFPNETVYITGALQAGFWIIVATDDANVSLAQQAYCRLAWDNVSAALLGGTLTSNDMSTLFVTPVPEGAHNPWNGSPPAQTPAPFF